jgi:hypothetical protein
MFVKFSTNRSFWELVTATCEFFMNLVQIKGLEFIRRKEFVGKPFRKKIFGCNRARQKNIK